MPESPSLDPAFLPSAYLRKLVAAIESAGHDPLEVLATENLTRDALTQTSRIPADVYGRLYQRSMVLLDDESLGTVSVRPVRAGTFRFMCLSVVACPTLGAVLRRIGEFLDVVDGGGVKPSVSIDEDTVRIGFGVPQRCSAAELDRVLSKAEPVQIRTSLYYWNNLLAWFVGRALELRQVEFAFSESSEGYDWRALFGAPVVFDAEESVLVVPRRMLSLPNVQNEQTLNEFLRDTPYRLLVPAFVPPSLQDRLRALFNQLPDGAPPTSEDMASRVGMSVSTLRRKLAAEGISWQELKEEGRRATALRYVADTDLPIAEITQLLGFDEASTFFRAFRRWTGTTPSRYRQTMANATQADD